MTFLAGNGKNRETPFKSRGVYGGSPLIELCDKICDQHIRDDDNSYKELEFDRGAVRSLSQADVA